MNFWANKLAANRQHPTAPQHVPPPQQQTQPQQYRTWWDDIPTPQPAQPEPQLQQPQPQFSVPQQARGIHAANTCPECGGSSYMSVKPDGITSIHGPARSRCFDCGYPYVQMGSRNVGIAGDGKVHASRQVHDGSSQVMPGFIAHL